jgi:hypothetical protein
MGKPNAERAGVSESTYIAKGASLLANPFGVGFIDWLGVAVFMHLVASRLLQVFAQGFDSLVD